MESRLLTDRIYTLKKVLSNKEFVQVVDEFTYNRWVFNKKELNEGISQPFRGTLEKNNYDPIALGDNHVLINIGSRLKYQIAKLLYKEVELIRVNTNIQFFGHDSPFHKDADIGSWSLVVFCNSYWDSSWGGEFVVRNLEDEYSYVAFIPNNGVLIPGWLDHTGMGPNRLSNQPRLSLAFTYQEV
jgi:hypothetical protein